MKNIIFIASLLIAVNLQATETFSFEKKKVITKSFPASAAFDLEIINKHGNITFETWEKDSIKVSILIEVQSDKLDKVNELIDKIDVRFTSYTQFVSAYTEWNNAIGLKADIASLFSNQNISVNYTIMLPDGVDLNIENKFGDIAFGNYSGDLKIDLSHGKLFGNTLKEGKLLNISYGDLRVKNIEKADIVSKFSDISINKIAYLMLDAKSSDIEIKTIKGLKLDASNSKIEIGKVNKIDFEVSFSDMEIEELDNTIEGEIKFGSLEIEKVSKSFKKINLKGNNTDIALAFNPQIAFNYFVQMEKGTSFRIPSAGNQLKNKKEYEEIKEYEGLFSTTSMPEKIPNVSIRVKKTYVAFALQ